MVISVSVVHKWDSLKGPHFEGVTTYFLRMSSILLGHPTVEAMTVIGCLSKCFVYMPEMFSHSCSKAAAVNFMMMQQEGDCFNSSTGKKFWVCYSL